MTDKRDPTAAERAETNMEIMLQNAVTALVEGAEARSGGNQDPLVWAFLGETYQRVARVFEARAEALGPEATGLEGERAVAAQKGRCCKCDEPVWPWHGVGTCSGSGMYCERHERQAGYVTTAEIDPDKLAGWLEGTGGELVVNDPLATARALLEACKP